MASDQEAEGFFVDAIDHDLTAHPFLRARTLFSYGCWSNGDAWFTVDQPSTQFASVGVAEIAEVGVELDRKLAALLEALEVEIPSALLQS